MYQDLQLLKDRLKKQLDNCINELNTLGATPNSSQPASPRLTNGKHQRSHSDSTVLHYHSFSGIQYTYLRVAQQEELEELIDKLLMIIFKIDMAKDYLALSESIKKLDDISKEGFFSSKRNKVIQQAYLNMEKHLLSYRQHAMSLIPIPEDKEMVEECKAEEAIMAFDSSPLEESPQIEVHCFTWNLNMQKTHPKTIHKLADPIMNSLMTGRRVVVLFTTQEEQKFTTLLINQLHEIFRKAGHPHVGAITIESFWTQTDVTPSQLTLGGFVIGENLKLINDSFKSYQHRGVNANKGGIVGRFTILDGEQEYKITMAGVHLESYHADARMQETIECMRLCYSAVDDATTIADLDKISSDLLLFAGDQNYRSYYDNSRAKYIHPLDELPGKPKEGEIHHSEHVIETCKHAAIRQFPNFHNDPCSGLTYGKLGGALHQASKLFNSVVKPSKKRRDIFGEQHILEGGYLDGVSYFLVNAQKQSTARILANETYFNNKIGLDKSDHAAVHQCFTLKNALTQQQRTRNWLIGQLISEQAKVTLIQTLNKIPDSYEKHLYQVALYQMMNGLRFLQALTSLACLRLLTLFKSENKLQKQIFEQWARLNEAAQEMTYQFEQLIANPSATQLGLVSQLKLITQLQNQIQDHPLLGTTFAETQANLRCLTNSVMSFLSQNEQMAHKYLELECISDTVSSTRTCKISL